MAKTAALIAVAVWASAAPGAGQEPLTETPPSEPQTPARDPQIAEIVAQWHPIAPDIRLPTRAEISLIGSSGGQAFQSIAGFLRISGFERLINQLQASFGPSHPLTGGTRLRFANELARAQQLERAADELAQARKIIEARVSRDNLLHLQLHDIAQYLLYQSGDYQALMADARAMQERVERDFAGNADAKLIGLNALAIAHYRLGEYDAAVAMGARRLALFEQVYPEPSAGLSVAIADQVQRLIAAGRLGDARTLIETRGAADHLQEVNDRYAIAALARARGAVFETRLLFEDARREYETAYRIHSAADFMNALPIPMTVPPDKGTFAAVRAALDLKRLEVRKYNSPGMLAGGWRQNDRIELDLGSDPVSGDGLLLSTTTALLKRSAPFRIEGPLQAMAARFNGFAYALGNSDHPLAEQFWRELVAYRIRSTGENSVKVGEALADLAGGLLAANRPFAAREEALKAVDILAEQLATTHPTLVRARAIAARALARQGRGDAAKPELDAALESAWASGEQAKRDLLALAIERDLGLQRESNPEARAAFWDLWGGRIAGFAPSTGFVDLERLAIMLVAMNQSVVDTGECPPSAIVDQLFANRETLSAVDEQDWSRFTEGPATRSLLATDQAIAEALTCGPQRGFSLTGFLRDLRDNPRYNTIRYSAQDISARNDRFARLLARDPGFGTDRATTELAMEYASDAAFTANYQITRARTMGEAATTDDRQARVLASEGVGFDVRYGLETQLDILWRAHEADYARGPLDPDDWEEKFYRSSQFDAAFTAAQLLRLDGNSQTLALASARAAAPNPELRETVAAYQSLTTQLFRELSLSAPSKDRLDDLQARHAELDNTIREEFPTYYDFASPQPLSLFRAREALKKNEGLLTIVTVGDDIYVFAISKSGGEAWHKVSEGALLVPDLVSALRCEVDPIECGGNAAVQTRGLAPESKAGAAINDWQGYDFNRNIAFELYETLIAPVAHVLDSEYDFQRVSRLYVVTSGAISALPLSVLVTSPPSDDGYDTSGRVFIDAPWLSDRYEIAYLPSVSDLKGSARALPNMQGFIGYGDPVLGPPVENATKGHRGGDVFVAARGANGVPLARPDALLKLASLKGAEAELAAVASLFPGASRLATKAAATEPAIKQDRAMAGSQVILFSTHGVLPDPALGNAEPGLVMTPPQSPSESDDGLLSASEAAALDFTSELLILSACNTATEGSFSGADSLSGLARAFIFAGARSVYASHWQVSDTITKELIFAAVDIALREPDLTRSQALAKAMRAIRQGEHEDGRAIEGWTPDWSHPSAWAPFVAITSLDRTAASAS